MQRSGYTIRVISPGADVWDCETSRVTSRRVTRRIILRIPRIFRYHHRDRNGNWVLKICTNCLRVCLSPFISPGSKPVGRKTQQVLSMLGIDPPRT